MHELELNDAAAVEKLIELCTKGISDQEIRSKTIDLIIKAKKTQNMVVSLDTLGLDGSRETIPLAELAKLLAKLVAADCRVSQINERVATSCRSGGSGRVKTSETCSVRQQLPRNIVRTFKTIKETYNDLLA